MKPTAASSEREILVAINDNLDSALSEILIAIQRQGERIMSELDNLKKAVADVQAAASAEAARVEEIIAMLRNGQATAADIQAAADALEVVAANLNAVEPAPAPEPPADPNA